MQTEKFAKIVEKVSGAIVNKLAYYGLKTNKNGYIVYDDLEFYIVDDTGWRFVLRHDGGKKQRYLKSKYEEIAKKFPNIVELEKNYGIVPTIRIKKSFLQPA